MSEKTEKRVISEDEVPLCIRKNIQKQENMINKKEIIREKIQNKMESIFLNNFIIPLNKKDTEKLSKIIGKSFHDMKNEIFENAHRIYIKENQLLPEVANFDENLTEKLVPILYSLQEKLSKNHRTYIDTLNRESLNIKNEILKVYANVYTEKIVDIIAEKELEDQSYIGGEFKLIYNGDSAFLSCKLYFQNKRRQWEMVSLKTIPIKSEYIGKGIFGRLQEKEELSFEF